MAWLGGSDEVVVGDVEACPCIGKLWSDGVAKCLRGLPCSVRSLTDFEAVFIGAGEVHHIVAEQAMPTAERVTNNGCVCMTKVGFRVDVINWGSDVKAAHPVDATGVTMLRLGM